MVHWQIEVVMKDDEGDERGGTLASTLLQQTVQQQSRETGATALRHQ